MYKCNESNCLNPHLARGYCQKHYSEKRYSGEFNTKRKPKPDCSVPNCIKKAIGLGFCTKHYQRWRKNKCLTTHREDSKKCNEDNCHNIVSRNVPFCFSCYHRRHMAEAIYTPQQRYNQAKRNAKKREIIFELTLEQYKSLVIQPCYYCEEIYRRCGVGLDRINNSMGYELSNVLPCCGDCNTIRGNKLTVEETKQVIKLLQNTRKTQRIWD